MAAVPTRPQEGSGLPVHGLLPFGVLDPQGAQNRIHQRLVLEDDPPEAVQERHGGGPRERQGGRTFSRGRDADWPRSGGR